MAEYICSMWLTFEPVPPASSIAASGMFDRIWPRSSEWFWRNMRVEAMNIEEMLQKLRQDFITNLPHLSPIPNKATWTILPPLQDEIWYIGSHDVHERGSTVEYKENGVDKQWTMDYGGASPTPILVRARWQEVRQL